VKPARVATLPDAIYWAADKMQSAVAIAAGAYLIAHGHPVVGTILIVLGCL